MSKRPNAWLTHCKSLCPASLERDEFLNQKHVLRPLDCNFTYKFKALLTLLRYSFLAISLKKTTGKIILSKFTKLILLAYV